MLRNPGREPGPVGNIANEEHGADTVGGRRRRQLVVGAEVAVGLEQDAAVTGVELTRFRGHFPLLVEREVYDASSSRCIPAGIPAEDGRDVLTSAEREELSKLRCELKQVKLGREILAKATAWFAREADTTSISGRSCSEPRVRLE